ncbi:MAG TPA: transporter substrate-binding domain-containing protein [Rectinemataceae bacterium]|nr:transporter substrate-binding domain-containing protein [Rectinemataceae bacterium]
MRGSVLLMLALVACSPPAVMAQRYSLGFATGYPPYQFREGGKPAGLDIELAKVLAKYGLSFSIIQDNWDDVVARLRNRVGMNIVGGMEISAERAAQFDFSPALYFRKNVVFVPAGTSNIKGLVDLEGKIVSGDRGSYVENRLDKMGIKDGVRLVEYESKEDSMKALKDGKVVASIMPDAVGFYLAKRLGVAVRLIDVGDPGSPVGFAARKGDASTLASVDAAIQKALASHAFDPVFDKWLN